MSSLALARGFGIATACLLGMIGSAVVSSACVLQLDISIACGDGYVDLEAGEECDPDDPDRAFESACGDIGRPQGTAQCDEETCRIDNSFATCAFCGDGNIDAVAGEECEGSNLNGQVCPGGAGTLQCKDCKYDDSACKKCGNGEVDDGEECDPGEFTLATPQPCAGDEDTPGILSPYQGDTPKQYASGTYQFCNASSCTWIRSLCSYCGDGVVDEDELRLDPLETMSTSIPEDCDGPDAFSETRLQESNFWAACQEVEDPDEAGVFLQGLRPNLKCNSICTIGGATADDDIQVPGLLPAELVEVQHCCVRAGATCPEPGTPAGDLGFKCCWEYAHPDEVAAGTDPCESPIAEEIVLDENGGLDPAPGLTIKVCRPFGQATG